MRLNGSWCVFVGWNICREALLVHWDLFATRRRGHLQNPARLWLNAGKSFWYCSCFCFPRDGDSLHRPEPGGARRIRSEKSLPNSDFARKPWFRRIHAQWRDYQKRQRDWQSLTSCDVRFTGHHTHDECQFSSQFNSVFLSWPFSSPGL